MQAKLLFALLLCCGSLSAATLYKVVAEDGSVTYTDKPQVGAQVVELSAVNTAVMPSMVQSTAKARTKVVQKSQPTYQLRIVSPLPEATVRNNLGELIVRGQLEPQASGIFDLYLDGQKIRSNPIPSFTLAGIDRGAHTLEIKLTDKSGKILASTPVQTVYLHKASALINAR
jgi:hypothetical protein